MTFRVRLEDSSTEVEVAGRGERIRTSDLSVPNRAHYQAVLRPEITDDFKETSCRRGCILRVKVNGVKRTTFQSAKFPHQSNCLCPVADPVFDFFRQFSERLTVAVRNEDRIIAKA